MTPNPGDIVLVDVPFSDGSGGKTRPVLVLRQQDAEGDFLAAPITSRSGHSNTVPLTSGDLAHGALPKASWIRADKVFTLHTSAIVKGFGAVRPKVLGNVASILCPQVGCRS